MYLSISLTTVPVPLQPALWPRKSVRSVWGETESRAHRPRFYLREIQPSTETRVVCHVFRAALKPSILRVGFVHSFALLVLLRLLVTIFVRKIGAHTTCPSVSNSCVEPLFPGKRGCISGTYSARRAEDLLVHPMSLSASTILRPSLNRVVCKRLELQPRGSPPAFIFKSAVARSRAAGD